MKFTAQSLGESLRAVRPRALLAALEVGLAILLAVQAARLVWALVTPLGPFGSTPPAQAAARPAADLSILASFDPFFRMSAATGPATAEGGGGVVLYGVRAGPGGRGSAILAADGGAQRSVTVGEEFSPGVTLAAVGPDHVIIARGGGRQRVGFPVPQAGAGAPVPAAPSSAALEAPAATAAVDPQRLLGQTTLVPRMRDGQPAGYTVFPRGGSDVLAQVGLRQGDVLLAVDGVALTPERVSELPQTLAASTSAEIRFERGGQTMTTRVRMSPK